MPMSIRLPLPPSVNSYWQRTFHGGMCVGKAGREYRDKVRLAVYERFGPVKRTAKAIAIEIFVTNSSQWPADLDNVRKALYDSLCAAHLFWDDAQVMQDSGKIVAVDGRGFVDVRIHGIGEFESLPQYAQKKVMLAIKEQEIGRKPKRERKPVASNRRRK